MPTDTKKSATLKERVESDFNPAESARERLERLQREAKEAEAQVKAEEQKGLNEQLRSIVEQLILEDERITGRKCRNFTVRYQQPGDGDPSSVPLVVKLEQGKPGLVISHKVVKPRQKDS